MNWSVTLRSITSTWLGSRETTIRVALGVLVVLDDQHMNQKDMRDFRGSRSGFKSNTNIKMIITNALSYVFLVGD